jgi:predicted nucleic acid-binding protein
MKPTVYIETTIPSYYFDEREDLRRDIARTREWWNRERNEYECFISPIVLAELEHGDYPHRRECMSLVQSLPVLELTDEVEDIAEAYWQQHVMPRKPSGDAAHLAIASHYRIDYLLTWNCKHLANVRKEKHLRILNARLGLWVPRLVTPLNLQLTEDES